MTCSQNNILFIGGGITTSLITFLLRNQRSNNFHIWEKDDDIGGRMKTWLSKHSHVPIDFGAQYITTNKIMTGSRKEIYDFLLMNHVVHPSKCYIENEKINSSSIHFVAIDGMKSIVKYFLSSNPRVTNICVSRTLTKLDIIKGSISATDSTGFEEIFKTVILTIPVPEIFKIKGNFLEKVSKNTINQLEKVKYSSRFALIAVYKNVVNTNWAAMYTPTDEIFRFIAIQEKKLGVDHVVSSVIFHTSIQFGEKFDESEETHKLLMNEARKKFPEWKEPIESFCYKWKYSQILNSFPDSPGSLVLCSDPLIILTGDGFNVSNLDGCLYSASVTTQNLMKFKAIPEQ